MPVARQTHQFTRATLPTHMATKTQQTVDEYIGKFPTEAQRVLQDLRRTILDALPEGATETIRYNMAAFQVGGKDVVYFAGWKKHVSLYSITDAMREAVPGLLAYKNSGVTVQFPYDRPLPTDVIADVVRWRLEHPAELERG